MTYSYPEQAAAIFLFLRKIAGQNRTVTYGETAVGISRTSSEGRLIAPALQILHEWCVQNGQPAITALVVKDETREVGDWLSSRITDLPAERQKVFSLNWSEKLPRLVDLQSIKAH
jgi:hypothetical protein